MHRVRMLVILTQCDVSPAYQKQILVSNILQSLLENKLAIYLATVNPTLFLKERQMAKSENAMIA